LKRAIFILPVIYLSWIAMLAVHEFGHVIHAWLSGGHVTDISFPLLGFSQTFVDPNPHPLIVAVGGPLWGAAIPTLIIVSLLCVRRKPPEILWFFTGFCLISNGAYIGLGWLKNSGDAHDMARQGMPIFIIIVFGAVCTAGGLLCWHQIRLR
jgi:hypothetical protein